MTSLKFLGTGGGRFVMLTQRRASGGIWLNLNGKNAIVDPGPGSLINALKNKIDLGGLDAIFCTHNHLDHYGEVELMVEAMTHGLHRRHGVIYMEGKAAEYVSSYHREKANLKITSAGDSFSFGDVLVEALPTHEHAGGFGLKFKTSSGVLTLAGDTGYSKELAEKYRGSKLLVLNTIFPSGRRPKTHLCTDTAVEIARIAKPQKLVITHFGVRMLNIGPEIEARKIMEETGIETIAAEDGMTLEL
jgi:ribonuclease BN (tRNA processing enzyme)